MKRTALLLVIATSGCTENAPNPESKSVPATPTESAAVTSVGTLKLGNESFVVEECRISGYLGLRDDKWYCRWCINAKAESRTFTESEDGDSYEFEAQPSLSANTIPVEVTAWRDLDGQAFKTGKHGAPNFYDNNDPSADYTLRTISSFELCHNNSVNLEYVDGTRFSVIWTGESYFHGVSDSNQFTLNAIATLTSVSLSSEVDDESEVDDTEIARIFSTVFPHDDFQQHPAKIRRIDEDNFVTIDFNAKFTPK